MEIDTNLVWMDLEMTGLNPDQDVILEIATIITDSNLNILEEGPHFIVQQPAEVLDSMGQWVKNLHQNSGLLKLVQESEISIREAEKQTLAFIKKHCPPEKALLCGNSVWQDRAFLRNYMPSIIDYLYYRLIDVTSFKEMILRWYPNDPDTIFQKKDTHRALDDIRESIAELRHYRKYFFV